MVSQFDGVRMIGSQRWRNLMSHTHLAAVLVPLLVFAGCARDEDVLTQPQAIPTANVAPVDSSTGNEQSIVQPKSLSVITNNVNANKIIPDKAVSATTPNLTEPGKSEPGKPEIDKKTTAAKAVATPQEEPDTGLPKKTVIASAAPTQETTSRPAGQSTLEQQIGKLVVPAPWLADVKPKWSMSEPWSKGRKEIRRLLAYGKQQQHREAIKLTWDYLQKDDIGNGHEYPMYLFLGGEPVWAVLAHREFLAQKHEHTPIHAMISLAAIYRYLGEFELAEKQLADAMNNLPDPPWRVMRQAEFHDGYGDLYVAWGKLDKAKHHYEQAVRIYPTAKPKYGGHLLPRKAKKVQSKLDLMSFDALANTRLKDGKYRDKAVGYTGDINLTINVAAGRIANIDVRHTEKIDQNACVIIPKRIIEKQSLKVDGISGATITKDAIVAGTYRALKQAGLK
jgi:uncharacterized protein with FMN-binding domain